MLEGDRQGIDQVDIDKRAPKSRTDKGKRVFALCLEQENITQTDDERLYQPDHNEKHPSAKICLCRREIAHALIPVHLQLKNRDQYNAADPDRQIRVKRRHCGAVILDRKETLGRQLHR